MDIKRYILLLGIVVSVMVSNLGAVNTPTVPGSSGQGENVISSNDINATILT